MLDCILKLLCICLLLVLLSPGFLFFGALYIFADICSDQASCQTSKAALLAPKSTTAQEQVTNQVVESLAVAPVPNPPVPVASVPVAPLTEAVQDARSQLIELKKTMNIYRDNRLARANYPATQKEIILQVAVKYHLSPEQMDEYLTQVAGTDL